MLTRFYTSSGASADGHRKQVGRTTSCGAKLSVAGFWADGWNVSSEKMLEAKVREMANITPKYMYASWLSCKSTQQRPWYSPNKQYYSARGSCGHTLLSSWSVHTTKTPFLSHVRQRVSSEPKNTCTSLLRLRLRRSFSFY